MVIRVLTAPVNTYHIELIYETRSSIPNQTSTILTNTISTHTRDNTKTQDIRKLEKIKSKDQDIETESDEETIDQEKDDISLNKRERVGTKTSQTSSQTKAN